MWEIISFVQGKVRRTCLDELASGPKSPSMIAKVSSQHLSHICRALRELRDKGLVECLTPRSRKNRFYRITTKGKDILRALIKLEKKRQ